MVKLHLTLINPREINSIIMQSKSHCDRDRVEIANALHCKNNAFQLPYISLHAMDFHAEFMLVDANQMRLHLIKANQVIKLNSIHVYGHHFITIEYSVIRLLEKGR